MMEGARAARWQAAGVRHELLMRVLPAIRHDMAGPLSVARMGNSVLKRYLVVQPFDADKSAKRLDQTDEQLAQLLNAVRALSRWDTDGSERLDAATLLADGLQMARPILDLHGMVLELPDAADTTWMPAAWPALQPARALYGVIGALSYLQDTAAGPASIRVQAAEGGLLLQATPSGTGGLPEDQRPTPRALAIDPAALACLAQDLRWPMDIQPGAVLLRLPDAG
ncbi:MAG: hypothetical protein V4505_17930 [Pseudomonadota bacterium]